MTVYHFYWIFFHFHSKFAPRHGLRNTILCFIPIQTPEDIMSGFWKKCYMKLAFIVSFTILVTNIANFTSVCSLALFISSIPSIRFWKVILFSFFEIRSKVAVDQLNDAQPWKYFQRLVTYAVYVDYNLQQVKVGLGIATTKIGEK